jgi:hypothetical protein
MPNGISANLLAQADERDPRTLGTNEIETPGGEMDVGELLSARSEDLSAAAQDMRGTLEQLSSHFNRVAGFEYDQFTRRGRRGQRILSDIMAGREVGPRKLEHLKRAMDPQHDTKKRARFEVLRGRELMRTAGMMTAAAAQLRQLDPAADQIIKGMIETQTKVMEQEAKIDTAEALTNRLRTRNEAAGHTFSPEYYQEAFADFAGAPNPNEVMTNRAKFSSSVVSLAKYYTKKNIQQLIDRYPDEETAIRGALKEAEAEAAKDAPGKVDISAMMQPKNLTLEYRKILSHEQSLLSLPEATEVLEKGMLGFTGATTVAVQELPGMGPLVDAAQLRALDTFAAWIENSAGRGWVARAIDRVPVTQDILELWKERRKKWPEGLPSEEWAAEKKRVRDRVRAELDEAVRRAVESRTGVMETLGGTQ